MWTKRVQKDDDLENKVDKALVSVKMKFISSLFLQLYTGEKKVKNIQ